MVANPAYLKGQAGVVLLENSIAPTADTTFDLGNSFTARWRALYSQQTWQFGFGGPGRIRRTVPFEDDTLLNYQSNAITGAGGDVSMGGQNQLITYFSEVQLDKAGFGHGTASTGATSSAFPLTWFSSKKPYARVEHFADGYGTATGTVQFWFGFRGSASWNSTAMPTSDEVTAVIRLNTGSFELFVANGSTATSTATMNIGTISSGTRHVLEIFAPNATRWEARVDGTVVGTTTAFSPSGTMASMFLARSTVNGTDQKHNWTWAEWITEQDPG